MSDDAGGRQRLLAAAAAEVAEAEVGPGEVSLRAIARRAGLSHNAAQHHFGDRAGLFTALAVQGFDELAADMAAAAAGHDEPLRAIGVAYVEFGLRRPNLLDLMFRPELLRRGDPALREAERRTFGALETLAERASGGQAEPGAGGQVGPAAPTAALAAWAYVHGLVALARVGVLVPPEEDPDRDRAAAMARRLVGLARPPGGTPDDAPAGPPGGPTPREKPREK